MGPLGLNFSVLTITPLSLSVTNTQAATEKKPHHSFASSFSFN